MTRISDQILAYIPLICGYLKTQPVEKAWLFGSCSRGEENASSDVDILVRYSESFKVSLFTISSLRVNLRKLINRPVDVVEEGRLLPFAVSAANHDKVLIYERKA